MTGGKKQCQNMSLHKIRYDTF